MPLAQNLLHVAETGRTLMGEKADAKLLRLACSFRDAVQLSKRVMKAGDLEGVMAEEDSFPSDINADIIGPVYGLRHPKIKGATPRAYPGKLALMLPSKRKANLVYERAFAYAKMDLTQGILSPRLDLTEGFMNADLYKVVADLCEKEGHKLAVQVRNQTWLAENAKTPLRFRIAATFAPSDYMAMGQFLQTVDSTILDYARKG